MQVKKLMNKQVASCPSHENLERAAQVMCELDCGCVPVIDSGGKVVGMLTDRDICMAAYYQGRLLGEIPVSSAMSREVFGCLPDDDLTVAEFIMERKQVHRLPVIDEDGRLVGLLSLTDIARRSLQEEGKRHPLKGLQSTEVAHTLARISQPRVEEGFPLQGF